MIDTYHTTNKSKTENQQFIQNILSEKTGSPPKQHVLINGKDGKPFCSTHPYHFNLSHTGDDLIIAISDLPVGIDLEKSNRQVLPAVRERITSHENNLMQLNDIECWVVKEAAVKYSGGGFSHMSGIVFASTLVPGEWTQFIHPEHQYSGYITLRHHGKFIWAVATSKPAPINCHWSI